MAQPSALIDLTTPESMATEEYRLPTGLSYPPKDIQRFLDSNGAVPLRHRFRRSRKSQINRAKQRAEQRIEALVWLNQSESHLGIPAERNDYLNVGPTLTKTKVQSYDKGLYAIEDQKDKGKPLLPKPTSKALKSVFDPEKDEPWTPTVLFNERLIEAHEEHAVSRATELNLVIRAPSKDPSWKRHDMIKRLAPSHKAYLREWSKRTERSSDANESTDGHPTSAVIYGYKLKLIEKDSLEDVFDEPNVAVGAFNKHVADLYFDRERQEIVQDLRGKSWSVESIDQVQERVCGKSNTELAEQAEQAKEALIASGQLLPAKTKPKKPSVRAQGKQKAQEPSTEVAEALLDLSSSNNSKRKAEEASPEVEASSSTKRQRIVPTRYR